MSGANAAMGAAVAAAIQASKASGVIISVSPADFLSILGRNSEPLVVHATAGFFSTHHEYLTSYRGLAFFTKASEPLSLPRQCEVVEARKIWIPGS